ncbi:hypothetical protein [Subtercola sp. YIM 133946]|uniref:hypothetical protein n=1 Tax=Subtercola sp. YIM 133946 TaxID=3118909 RepID=UPI002F926652
MSTILVCATPNHGHVAPMVEIARRLADRGNTVTVLTGSRFEPRVVAAGLAAVSLEGTADFDDRDQASYLPDRDRYRGIAQAQYDIQTMFIETIPSQFGVLRPPRSAARVGRVRRGGASGASP